MTWYPINNDAQTYGIVNPDNFDRTEGSFGPYPLLEDRFDILEGIYIDEIKSTIKNLWEKDTEEEWHSGVARTTAWTSMTKNCTGRVAAIKGPPLQVEFELEEDAKRYEEALEQDKTWRALKQ